MYGSFRSINRLVSVCIALIAVLLFEGCQKESPPESNSGYRFQYAAKALCISDIPGTSQTTASLLPGAYETVVNIHNPAEETVRFRMKIAVASRQVSQFIHAQLGPDEAMSVSCAQILEKFGITFIHGFEGFLVIESVGSLDVTAVYTAGHVGGEVKSIAVEQIKERKIKRHPPTGRLPDLVVQNIDLNTLDVVCPGGNGTCVTKINITVANIGAGPAEAPFNVKIIFDPDQSVVVNHTVTADLPAGNDVTFTVTTPPDGNCFDPDCTICVIVDNLNVVVESNDTNNEDCKTKNG